MDTLNQKIQMGKKLLTENPSMFYLKIGATLIAAYFLGKISRR